MKFSIILILVFPCFLYSQTKSLSVIAVGDMMYGTDFPSSEYLIPDNNPTTLVQDVIPVFDKADLRFGNLEGCFLDGGTVYKNCKDTTKCYAFRTPVSYSDVLNNAGFDVVNLANNHIRDFGPPGLISTKSILEKLQIAYVGLEDRPSDTLWINGLKIGICGFSPNTGTTQIGDLEGAKKIVNSLKSKCDIVIVSFHGGAEGSKHQNVTRQTEQFYGENRGNVYKFAHLMIDNGADIIFGHGPHVPRAIEVYKNRFISYSLGNFCTYSRFNLDYPNNLTPVIEVHVSAKGQFIKGKIHPFVQIKGLGVLEDSQNKVIAKITDLTRNDFPELNNSLVIDSSGDIFKLFSKCMIPKGLDHENIFPDTKELKGYLKDDL